MRLDSKSSLHIKERLINWTSSKLKALCSVKARVKSLKSKLQAGQNYLQTIYLTKDKHVGYKKNTYNLMVKKILI